MKTIVYLAHPRLDRSEINGPMFKMAKTVDGVSCVDLYAEYPTFEIDVAREQSRLVEHDVVIFLHPVYWYSAPSLVKEWQDLVLEHGFAYGHDGHALDDKVTFNAISCGAEAHAYAPDGENGADLRTLLVPFEKTADLCRMRFLAPFVLFGAGRAREDGRAQPHLDAWRALLFALRDDRLDIEAGRNARTLNAIASDLTVVPEPA